MDSESEFEVRHLEGSKEDAEAVFRFLIPMYFEVGRMEGDANTIFLEIYRVLKDEIGFVIERDGEIIASAGIIEARMWYAKDGRIWAERWFYIRPDYRDHPRVLRLMLAEVKAFVEHTGRMAMIVVFNPKRFVRGAKTAVGQVAEQLAIRPAGTVIAVAPGVEDGRQQREHEEYDAVDVDELRPVRH